MPETFRLAAWWPFSLATSTRFLAGFTPAGYTGTAGPSPELTAAVRARDPAGPGRRSGLRSARPAYRR